MKEYRLREGNDRFMMYPKDHREFTKWDIMNEGMKTLDTAQVVGKQAPQVSFLRAVQE